MKKIVLPVLLSFMIFLTACPYQSKVSLGPVDNAEKYDKLLIGEWSCKNDDGSFVEITFSTESKKSLHAYLTNIDKNKVKSQAEYFKSWATNVNNNLIFNAQSTDSSFVYFKADIAGNDKIYITYIDEKFVKENFQEYQNPTSEQLHQFVQTNISKAELFSNRLMFVRIGSALHKLQQSKKGF